MLQLIKLEGLQQVSFNLSTSIFSSVQLDNKTVLLGSSESFNEKHLAQCQAHDKRLIKDSYMVMISILKRPSILCNYIFVMSWKFSLLLPCSSILI